MPMPTKFVRPYVTPSASGITIDFDPNGQSLILTNFKCMVHYHIITVPVFLHYFSLSESKNILKPLESDAWTIIPQSVEGHQYGSIQKTPRQHTGRV